MNLKRWIPWLVVVYLVAMLVMLPARVIYWFPLPDNVRLSQVSGSLWQGVAGQVVVDGMVFNNLSWDWQVSSIFLGELVVDVNLPDQNNPLAFSGRLLAGSTKVGAKDVTARGDLSALLQLVGTRLPLKTDGEWNLSVDTFVVTAPGPVRWCDELQGNAKGEQIRVLINNQWQSLGNFPVELGCSDTNAVSLTMSGDNSLGLEFNGRINSQSFRAEGTVKPTPRTPEGLAKMMQYMGTPDSRGRYSFRL
ncbi:type II secretion system protein N [Idiomarina sp. HP20-50]|uniref:type II secretion system protein N n=1 Tax=Idiomarina sp. HP20-50 TaxID=3070813 RepID=UPI00294B52CE|nr:type II secretion system protein N [Idiomarina sp. HP20-50]MDV6315777.1 type II secretion system protein N [Idiomarina sp. HP20-50]